MTVRATFIQRNETGAAKIDVIADETAWTLLAREARFTLHDSPSIIVAHGIVEDMLYPVETPLMREAYGKQMVSHWNGNRETTCT